MSFNIGKSASWFGKESNASLRRLLPRLEAKYKDKTDPADISNVKTVLVDGRVVKEDFRLKADLARPRQLIEASRDYLVGAFGEPEPGWLA